MAINYAHLGDVMLMKQLPNVTKQALSKARLGISPDRSRTILS